MKVFEILKILAWVNLLNTVLKWCKANEYRWASLFTPGKNGNFIWLASLFWLTSLHKLNIKLDPEFIQLDRLSLPGTV
jgi:hypothetical protein